MIDTTFEITTDVQKFLDAYKAYESVRSVKVTVDADGEKHGLITEELAQNLRKTKDLFNSEEYASARIEETEKRVVAIVEAILAEIGKKATNVFEKKAAGLITVTASSRFFDPYVGGDNASVTVSFCGLGEADDLIDDRDIEHEALYYRGARDSLSDALESWDWAAWLGDEASPFYSDDFAESYATDQASIALEQFSQTLDESSFKDDVRRDLEGRVAHLARELAED